MARPHPQRILIVRPSALGDVCRTVPVLASLRAALPDAHIAWVVQDDFAPAIEAHPSLNEVISFPRNRFAHWWRSPGRARELANWVGALRRRQFDVAIDGQGLGRSGLITLASGAPVRIGLRAAREFAWLCYNRRVPDKAADLPRHTVDQMLCVLEPLGVPAAADMRLHVSRCNAEWWYAEKQSLGLNEGSPYAVIAPGSRWPSKRWPIERFADLIEPLLKRGFARVIVIGSPSEREQVQPLIARMTNDELRMTNAQSRMVVADDSSFVTRHSSFVIDLVGRTSIGQTMALIADAGLVIANDSAPLHMAVGFDRPCVALYGPTDPAEVGPYGLAECVVRAYQPPAGGEPNFKAARLGDSLMRLISTAMALQAVDRVLALWPTRRKDVRGSRSAVRGADEQPTANHQPRTTIVALPHGLAPKAAS
jgi:heptosyltransferase-1